MQRAARYLLVGGTAAAVIGLGLAHATIHDEVYFRSFRLWWAIAYIILLCASAYAVGLPNLVRGRQAPVAALGAGVVAAGGRALSSLVAQAADLHAAGIRIRTLTGFCSEWLGRLPLSELERASLLFDIGDLHRATYARVKRIVDVAFAVLGLMLLAISIPFIVVGNLFANRGPLFFRQPRVGRNGETFRILKFRTMHTGAHGDGEWTAEDDPRLTPFGRILRRLHIDELPQMLNILRGELSVVGPRPEQPRYVDELIEKIPFYELRHLVRPGLTGWAQVKYDYGATDSDALEKLQYDFFYLQNQSVSLDVRVIRRTIRHVFDMAGR